MRALIFIFTLFLFSCNNGTDSSKSQVVTQGDFSGYTMTDIGNGVQRATRNAPEGFLAEMGHAVNGQKQGQWLMYDKNGNITKSENYINGNISGAVIDYKSGRVNSIAHYLNGKLDGQLIKYTGAYPEEIAHYKNGELDGKYQKYNRKSLIQEVDFKNGVQDGYMRYYDEDGNITMEYVYKNGEKVSGGMTQK